MPYLSLAYSTWLITVDTSSRFSFRKCPAGVFRPWFLHLPYFIHNVISVTSKSSSSTFAIFSLISSILLFFCLDEQSSQLFRSSSLLKMSSSHSVQLKPVSQALSFHSPILLQVHKLFIPYLLLRLSQLIHWLQASLFHLEMCNFLKKSSSFFTK